jgi:RNA polymerase primary sigma factor
MGQIPLLTKEEEIEISKKIEMGEDIIIDAICSVPYLIDFILDYKEPLINRERRVKELFKSFEDETEESETTKKNSKQDKRVQKVIESFKALEKAKKDWLKTLSKVPNEDASEEEVVPVTEEEVTEVVEEAVAEGKTEVEETTEKTNSED